MDEKYRQCAEEAAQWREQHNPDPTDSWWQLCDSEGHRIMHQKIEVLRKADELFRNCLSRPDQSPGIQSAAGDAGDAAAEALDKIQVVAEGAVELSSAAQQPSLGSVPQESVEKAAELLEEALRPEVSAVASTQEVIGSAALGDWCHRLPFSPEGSPLGDLLLNQTLDGFEVGSGPLLLLGPVVHLLQLVLLLALRSLGSHPRYPSEERAPASGYECGFSPFAAISSSSLVVFRQLAVYFVVFEAELIFLYPWSAALLPGSLVGSALGYYGALPFLLCLLVGFGLEIKRDALKL